MRGLHVLGRRVPMRDLPALKVRSGHPGRWRSPHKRDQDAFVGEVYSLEVRGSINCSDSTSSSCINSSISKVPIWRKCSEASSECGVFANELHTLARCG